MSGGEDACFVGQHEVDGTFIFATDNVARLVIECEFGILVFVGCERGVRWLE